MFGNIIGIAYLMLFWAAGCFLAHRTLTYGAGGQVVDFPLVLSLGSGFCVALLAVLPALVALVVGFNLIAAVLGAVLLCGIVLAVVLACKPNAAPTVAMPILQKWRATRRSGGATCPKTMRSTQNTHSNQTTQPTTLAFWGCVLPAVAFTFYLLYTHVLLAKNGVYYTGQSGYGDIAMHLAFIKSIAISGEMPPHYSLLAGQTLFGYPFLCESVSSVFLLFDAGLKMAYLLPCLPALCAVFGGVFCLARAVLGSVQKACVAFAFFALGGGFGFAYFLQSATAFQSIFTGYYTTPTNYVQENIRWVNAIADLLVPQRATLMGWALLFPCLYLLYRFAFCGQKKLWLPLGLLAGCLPLIHTHSLLVLVILSAVYLCYAVYDALPSDATLILFTRIKAALPALLPWLGYALVAGVLCLPQLFGVIFVQTGTGNNFLRWHFNWANDGDFYLWFYIKNLGVVYLLLLPALLWAAGKLRRWYVASLAVLLISECIVFQPNTYDNIKLLYIWFFYSCLLVAGAVCDWLALLPQKQVRGVLLAGVLFFATLSGALTLGREAISEYQVFDANDIAAADFIEQNTPVDALFLTGMQHLNPVASLAGRDIICGSTLYVYYHGMDYTAQSAAVSALYQTPSEDLLTQWGVDYVFISSYERASFTVDEAWYAARYSVVYQNSSITIYQIG